MIPFFFLALYVDRGLSQRDTFWNFLCCLVKRRRLLVGCWVLSLLVSLSARCDWKDHRAVWLTYHHFEDDMYIVFVCHQHHNKMTVRGWSLFPSLFRHLVIVTSLSSSSRCCCCCCLVVWSSLHCVSPSSMLGNLASYIWSTYIWFTVHNKHKPSLPYTISLSLLHIHSRCTHIWDDYEIRTRWWWDHNKMMTIWWCNDEETMKMMRRPQYDDWTMIEDD